MHLARGVGRGKLCALCRSHPLSTVLNGNGRWGDVDEDSILSQCFDTYMYSCRVVYSPSPLLHGQRPVTPIHKPEILSSIGAEFKIGVIGDGGVVEEAVEDVHS